VVADQNEKLLNESAEKLRGEGHNVLTVTCDVSDKAQVAAMIDLGRLGDPSAEEHADHLVTQLARLVQGEAHPAGPCAGPTRWLSRLRELVRQ
jgi:hypothetical protein